MLCVFCNNEFTPRYPLWVLLGHKYKLLNRNRPTHPTCFIQVCEPFVGFASKEKTLNPYQTWSTILMTSFVQVCQTFVGFAKRRGFVHPCKIWGTILA